MSPIVVPAGTVFLSSACIMILELVAGRLIARHLGYSLYTWTSVIGVVLAGITIGNYLGGRVADRFSAKRALAAIFGSSSVACVAIVVLNNVVPRIDLLWQFGLVFRVFSTVTLIFLAPSTLLGMISPVVAKMALDRGLPTGRTVGDIYAWGAAGSIVGTFLAGYYLIGSMGTVAIVWSVSVFLLLMAILYWSRFWLLYIWAAVLAALTILGISNAAWAADAGSALELRARPDPDILYEDESQYSYMAVRQVSLDPDTRVFMHETTRHSMIVVGHPEDLQFNYYRMYAMVTHRASRERARLSTLTIGGAGCAFPRYIEAMWPGSRIDVVEIDPRVIEAAMEAFGLPRDTSLNIYTMDARNYVDDLLRADETGGKLGRYDFIYGDAFSSMTVPFQLVTWEFNDSLSHLLTEDGLYVLNVIDTHGSGRFVGAVVNTLQQTFRHVYVLSRRRQPDLSSNFVIAASQHPIDLADVGSEPQLAVADLWVMDESEVESLRTKADGIILTDDYAPVDTLLAPVAVQAAERK